MNVALSRIWTIRKVRTSKPNTPNVLFVSRFCCSSRKSCFETHMEQTTECRLAIENNFNTNNTNVQYFRPLLRINRSTFLGYQRLVKQHVMRLMRAYSQWRKYLHHSSPNLRYSHFFLQTSFYDFVFEVFVAVAGLIT